MAANLKQQPSQPVIRGAGALLRPTPRSRLRCIMHVVRQPSVLRELRNNTLLLNVLCLAAGNRPERVCFPNRLLDGRLDQAIPPMERGTMNESQRQKGG